VKRKHIEHTYDPPGSVQRAKPEMYERLTIEHRDNGWVAISIVDVVRGEGARFLLSPEEVEAAKEALA